MTEIKAPQPAPSPWGRHDLMATAAVRYCLGRSSYIVGDCVDWLIQQQHAISLAALKIIVRDIREAMQRDDEARHSGDQHLPLGMDMDRREWERALSNIVKTVEKEVQSAIREASDAITAP